MSETLPQTPPEVKPKIPLEAEMEVFRRNQPMLQRENPEGGFVIINGDEILGVWRARPDALRVGIEKYGDVPFLVRDINNDDKPVCIPGIFGRSPAMPGAEPLKGPLAVEIEVFARNQATLQRDNPEGGFVVVKGEEILGVWRDYPDALRAGIEKYGDVPFLARGVDEKSDPFRYSRTVFVH